MVGIVILIVIPLEKESRKDGIRRDWNGNAIFCMLLHNATNMGTRNNTGLLECWELCNKSM